MLPLFIYYSFLKIKNFVYLLQGVCIDVEAEDALTVLSLPHHPRYSRYCGAGLGSIFLVLIQFYLLNSGHTLI